MATSKQFATVDEYVQACPKDVQPILEELRQAIHKSTPGLVEMISYGIPAFSLNGKCLVYFAAWKKHISVYPIPRGDEAFKKELAPYIGGKGTVKFPLGQPIPYDLVVKIVNFQIAEQ
jgi:uncharacterized protein YdhG (YjbR/CyaY superfamily)